MATLRDFLNNVDRVSERVHGPINNFSEQQSKSLAASKAEIQDLFHKHAVHEAETRVNIGRIAENSDLLQVQIDELKAHTDKIDLLLQNQETQIQDARKQAHSSTVLSTLSLVVAFLSLMVAMVTYF